MGKIAIIPARGGSKGLPGKNLLPLQGIPLVAHSVLQAVESTSVDRVIVSTDSYEIAEVANQFGGEVIWRPDELSGDSASTESAVLHVLDQIGNTGSTNPELVVLLQCTSPCRTPKDIDNAVQTLISNGADSCFSVCSEHFTGRWRLDGEDKPYPVNFSPSHRPRRQEYPIEYLENGNIYVFTSDLMSKHKTRIGGYAVMYPMSPLKSLQIDTKEDLDIIKSVLSIFWTAPTGG